MLNEYAEILTQHTTPAIASLVLDIILQSPNTILVTKHFFWQLIDADPDDNKFVDCGLIANADFIVTEDRHFEVLKSKPFPTIETLKAEEFLNLLVTTS